MFIIRRSSGAETVWSVETVYETNLKTNLDDCKTAVRSFVEGVVVNPAQRLKNAEKKRRDEGDRNKMELFQQVQAQQNFMIGHMMQPTSEGLEILGQPNINTDINPHVSSQSDMC